MVYVQLERVSEIQAIWNISQIPCAYRFGFSRPITTGPKAVTPATPATASRLAPTRAPATWRRDNVLANLAS